MAASQIGLRRRYSIQRDICPCIKGAENIAESGVAKSGYGAEGDGTSDRDNENGRLAILFPQDAHAPCIAAGESRPVRKVVVKVAVE